MCGRNFRLTHITVKTKFLAHLPVFLDNSARHTAYRVQKVLMICWHNAALASTQLTILAIFQCDVPRRDIGIIANVRAKGLGVLITRLGIGSDVQ